MPTETIAQYPLIKRKKDGHCCVTESATLAFGGAMQRCTQLPGLCLSAQKAHTKRSDSCWMHTDAHKQPSEKAFSLHCLETISIQLTRQPERRILGTYKRVCCVRLLPESGQGVCDSEGRCMEMCREVLLPAGPGWMGRRAPAPLWAPEAATLVQGMERKKAGIPTAARTMGRDEEALP